MDQEELSENIPCEPREAIPILMNRYGKWVVRLAYLHVNNSHSAEDIAQEVFIRVFRGWQKYREQSSLKAWLGTITINLCRDYYRPQGRTFRYESIEDQEDLESNSVTPEEYCLAGDSKERIKKGLETLSDIDRNITIMHYYFELKIVEIAKILNVKETTLRSRLCRTRKKLQLVLEMEEEKHE